MPPKKQNQPTGKAPILQMDSATFQATVTAAVAAALAVLNANNGNGNNIHKSNCSNTPGNHQRIIQEDTLTPKPKSAK